MFDHMIGFLNWLNDRRSDVMYFFGSLWHTALDVIRNAWQWIRNNYYDAVRYAREIANTLFREIDNRFRGALGIAWNYALSAYNNAVNFVRNEIGNFASWVINRIDGISRFVSDIRSEVIGWVIRTVEDVKRSFNGLVTSVRLFLTNRIEGAVRLVESVKQSLLREVFDIRNLIGWQNQERLRTLIRFLDDPLGFVMSYIKHFFLFMLEWSIAYAIGSTRENLPTWPRWEDVL